MKLALRKAIPLVVIAWTFSAVLHAEDIDIYTLPVDSLAAPNVLLFLDNTANWSNASQQWDKSEVLAKCDANADTAALCKHYVGLVFGANSSLVQGQVEARALRVVIDELACDTSTPLALSLGLMLLNDEGSVEGSNVTSSYIRHAIKKLAPGNAACQALQSDLDQIYTNITAPPYKAPQSADYGTALYEAFKYFGGYANTNKTEALAMGSPEGATGFGPRRYSLANPYEDPDAFLSSERLVYRSPIQEGFCGNNYIVLIGNAFPKQEFGTNQNAQPPTNTLMSRLGATPNQLFQTSNRANIRFADEWSEFLARTDVSEIPGFQPIKTFAINVFNKQESANQTALLNSMAKHGGSGVGGAFTVDGNLLKLINALKSVFTQIAAVNSSFASASLPISVNTQGTYLNQVFIGMFRPDESSRPRWAGNLKQYQFALRTTEIDGFSTRELFLADANEEPAIDNVNTGFIQSCAQSFWSSDSGNYWESVINTEPEWGIPQGSCPSFEHNDSPDGRVVERGGLAQRLRLSTGGPVARAIATCSAAPENCNSNTASTLSNFSDDYLKWIRGDNVGDGYLGENETTLWEDYDKPSNAVRPTVHGGVIHSRPLAMNYGAAGTDDVVVFYGADDGLLRAVNGNQSGTGAGSELWAFLAPEFVKRLERTRKNSPLITFRDDPTAPKDYFFDGSIGAYVGPENADGTGSEVKLIYPSMRRGGKMIYAFDVTAHPNTSAPTPLWRFGCDSNNNCTGGSDAGKLGYTWSTPRVIRVKNQPILYTVFGAGYDRCEDGSGLRDCSTASTGRGIFVLNAKTGAALRFIDLGIDAGRVVADLVPVDTNDDGFTDVLYAADTAGNLWRVNLADVDNPDALDRDQDDWEVTHVAKLADWSWQEQEVGTPPEIEVNERNRKLLYAPDVVRVGNVNIVLIGSGDREKPLEESRAAKVRNRFYGIWDEFALTGNSFATIDDSDDCDTPGDKVLGIGCELLNTTDTSLDYLETFSTSPRPRGWVIDLDDTSLGGPNEMVVTTPATVGGLVNFSTFQAKNPANACNSLGTARGYSACFLHGGATCDAPTGERRSELFVGGGMPPSPVTGLVVVDNQIVPFIIGGKPSAGGGSPLEAKLPSIPIRKDRTKVYRYKDID